MATALLTPTPEVPKQTAITESAIFYVYTWLEEQFNEDVCCGEDVWGRMVLDAYAESGLAEEGEGEDEDEEDEFTPRMGCGDASKWAWAIEALADRILWDRDWEMAHMFPRTGRAAS